MFETMINDIRCKKFSFCLASLAELLLVEVACVLIWFLKGCDVTMIPVYIVWMIAAAAVVISLAYWSYRWLFNFKCKCNKR